MMTESETPKSSNEGITKKISSLFLDEEDVGFEEDILRNPYSLRCWLRYIEHKKKCKSTAKQISVVYERALSELPGSYKLWYNYLRFRRRQVADKCPNDAAYEHVNSAFERALVFMHKMPRIWMDYCEFLTRQRFITRTRRAFDRALRALPVSQHDRIWPLYIKFAISHSVPESTIRIYRRCLKLFPKYREDFVEYLYSVDRLDDAAQELAKLVNDDKLYSERGKTSHQLWTELCKLISKNPKKIHSLNVEAVIRQGIHRYTDQVGILWCALAEYFIRFGQFEKARDVYEEAVISVKTVRDFTQIFDAYAKFVEREIAAKMDSEGGDSEDVENENLELDFLFARFEYLMDKRPLLLNSVILRQNPNNVHEWLNRVGLYENDREKQVETFEKSIATINPKQQTGKLSNLWIAYAKFYEKEKNFDKVRDTFERSLEVPFVKVDELASIWCEYAEFELRRRELDRVKKLLGRATEIPRKNVFYMDESVPVQKRVYKSLKIWSLLADITEISGKLEECEVVYERIIDLRIATPQTILNYANYLEERGYFEKSFKIYEKGVALFRWPHVNEIWSIYLVKFLERYGGKKLERARDLFEQCLDSCPPKFALKFYLLYAKVEEDYGLPRHAMSIYNRATVAVEKNEAYSVFNIYINKAASMYGLTHTRPIFERAIEILPEKESREMSLRFAQVERSLGEIDRARAIYAHCSEICDPRIHGKFWDVWKEFEVVHGNEETVREMLRIKRSVQATYKTNVNIMNAQMLSTSGNLTVLTETGTVGDSMALLEARAQEIAESNSNKVPLGGAGIRFIRGESNVRAENTTENPDEIHLDMDDDDDDDEEDIANKEVETRAVPSAVFGSLKPDDN